MANNFQERLENWDKEGVHGWIEARFLIQDLIAEVTRLEKMWLRVDAIAPENTAYVEGEFKEKP